MYMLAILESGNFAIFICNNLEQKGYKCSVVPIPCKISTSGCGQCLKFPEEIKDIVIAEAKKENFLIYEIYKILHTDQGINYVKVHNKK